MASQLSVSFTLHCYRAITKLHKMAFTTATATAFATDA